jgi:trk/ktr system potassium uptake protein
MNIHIGSRREWRFQPAQMLALSFFAAIVAGALLLMLPVCTVSGHISFIDALFTSTSAVCVTGLIVQDTPTFFSPVGQAVILLLFQLGGVGIMAFSTLVMLVAGKSISFKDRLVLQEGFQSAPLHDAKGLVRDVFLYTLLIEGAGALVLFLRLRGDFQTGRALYLSVFHSISAFCNAGFALFSDSFIRFRGDAWINAVLMLLIVLGGLGFLVLHECRTGLALGLRHRRVRLSLHTRLVLQMSAFLIFAGWGLFLALEWRHSLRGLPLGEKVLASLFQVITTRTAGFNTMDLNTLGFAAIFLAIMLMFVGASPGSTGGGIKTSTLGVILAFLRSKLAARDWVRLGRHSLPMELVTRAYTVVTLGIFVIAAAVFVIFFTHPWASMKSVFFEVFSAFGTVGLSLGLTPKLNTVGKIAILLTMYIGRIGPLTFLFAFSREKAKGRYEYAEESVMIG